jgi:hypothetical protein
MLFHAVKSVAVLEDLAMLQMSRITEITTFVASVAAVATAAQVLLMPQVHAWEAEIVAAFMRGLPQ